MRPPPTQRIPIHRIQQRLADCLKQLFRAQILFPQPLASPEELITRRAADDEVFCVIDAADGVETADERVSRLAVQAGNHRRYEPRAETALVEGGADELGKCLGGDGSLFAQAVQIRFVAERGVDGGDVGREAR